ncbi:DUF4253 domain-containing protein [Paenibacillus eucommiae]|uniref:DUF4253 domain-containing protein n=1 Tax=Paenibacillus eucommiae TaxID=1355755 RepID=A0ABS4J6S7_9BACL|nr:DUF4253 domain-containing protein [Paenibacillus eucommiae]MBP1995540.1 hypothetical protein [Paenibacillus eucommiae]
MTDDCKAILDFLNCDYELFENEKSGENILRRFNELTELGKEDGFIPLIVVASDTLAETIEFIFDDFDVENTTEGIAAYRANVIKEAEKLDVGAFLADRLAEYMDMHKDINVLGEFSEVESSGYFYSHMDGNTPHKEIILAKIPTRNPWELAAWIPMGGFNDCPNPKEQMAVFRRWHQKYGAVPGLVTYENWELELTNPPKSEVEAEILAKEQFAFCYDIVMQAGKGGDSIRALASQLKGSTAWYFWWD